MSAQIHGVVGITELEPVDHGIPTRMILGQTVNKYHWIACSRATEMDLDISNAYIIEPLRNGR